MDRRFHRKSWRRKPKTESSLFSASQNVNNITSCFFTTSALLLLSCLTHAANGTAPSFVDFRFQVEPSSLVVAQHSSATLDCQVRFTGQGRPKIEWFQVGDPVPLEDNAERYMLLNNSLYFKSVQHSKRGVSDTGQYRCAASIDQLGTILSRRATLDVAALPKQWIAQPQEVTLPKGHTAAFECIPDGAVGPTKVRWFKGPVKLLPSPNILLYPTGMLEILSLGDTDFGPYSCEVDVPGETIRSEPTLLTIADPRDFQYRDEPPEFLVRPRSGRVTKGDDAFLHCVTKGWSKGMPPTVSWLKDGTTLSTSNQSHILVLGGGTLAIYNVTEGDAGVYTCRATNLHDTEDAEATLTVLVAPQFKVTPMNTYAKTQSDVTLNCVRYGIPDPVVSWRKNGDNLRPSDYFKISPTGSLSILGVVDSDAGMYQCLLTNELGEVQSTAELLVLNEAGALYAEASLRPPTPVNLRAVIVSKRYVTLQWELPEAPAQTLALPPVKMYSVLWREMGSERERMSNTTGENFNIQGLKPSTNYEIRVRSYNDEGPSKSEAKIIVRTEDGALVPSPPENLRVVPLSSTSILATWDEPAETFGNVIEYVLFYHTDGFQSERNLTVKGQSRTISDLEEHTLYSVRVLAVNTNGIGSSSADVDVLTYSDKPSATPQNFTLEVTGASNLIVRWQPPPAKDRNGIITGYKIRLRTKGGKHGGKTVATDGNRNAYAISDLEKGTDYQVRIWAMTVNGSGPVTPWASATTFTDDLDEDRTPPKPAHLIALPKSDSIHVSWAPPDPNSKVLVRGYTLGYGVNIPDVYQKTLGPDEHNFVIKNLVPQKNYIISIRAFNNKGPGEIKYETVETSVDFYEEPSTPMVTPMGLRTFVLSSSSIMLTWSDHSLGKNHKISDSRYYTIRYKPVNSRNNKYSYEEAPDLNYQIKGLRPYTEYEFAVKVSKGRRESKYSMRVRNKTEEAVPGSVPRDVTPVALPGNPLAVSLNWQPPAQPNGKITGYEIYYTIDLHIDNLKWPMEAVKGTRLSTVIQNLTPDTTYHFRVLARNSKGRGPKSDTVIYVTPKVDSVQQEENKEKEEKGGVNINNIIIISASLAGGVVICAAIAITVICLCCCRSKRRNDPNAKGAAKPMLAKSPPVPPGGVKPPDLWIHQPQHLELQKMERSQRSESSASVATSTLRRGSRGSATDHTDDQASTLDRGRGSIGIGGEAGYPSSGEERYQPIQPRNLIRPKPVALPPDIQGGVYREQMGPSPNGHLMYGGPDNQAGQLPMRPIYPRTQYNTQYNTAGPRVNAGDLPHSSCPMGVPTPGKVLTAVDENEGQDGSISGGMSSGMEDSFNSRIGYVKPQPTISPYKKPQAPVMSTPNKGQRPPVAFQSKSPDLKTKKDEADLSKSLSTEELTAEMANLEGLMKDLNAITQQEFEC